MSTCSCIRADGRDVPAAPLSKPPPCTSRTAHGAAPDCPSSACASPPTGRDDSTPMFRHNLPWNMEVSCPQESGISRSIPRTSFQDVDSCRLPASVSLLPSRRESCFRIRGYGISLPFPEKSHLNCQNCFPKRTLLRDLSPYCELLRSCFLSSYCKSSNLNLV